MAKAKKTAETKPIEGAEIGRSGTNIFGGIIIEDYNAKLNGQAAIKIYDEMRKSDATVKAALLAIQLPIRRAEWFMKPASEDEADKEIADFVSEALFNYQSITWDDFLRQALLSTAYGVMVFEKVFEMKEVDGKTWICWKKFAPRLPKSILRWAIGASNEPGITQILPEGKQSEIPMEKLLVFVNEQEGDNYWGISCLRAAYKHWYIKSNLEKIDAMAHERQGLGVPFVKMSNNPTAEEITKAETILQNLYAHQKGYLLEPESLTVEFKDMKSLTTKDASRAIEFHDRQIVKAVLAQFINLGSGPNGSRALSSDQSDLFLQSLEAIANGICDVINKNAIKEIVDLNFDGVTKYPELDYTGISRNDIDALTTSYQRLVQSGGITPIEQDEQYMRGVMGLPEKPADYEADDQAEKIDQTNEDLGVTTTDKKKVNNSEIETAVAARLAKFSDKAKQMEFIEKTIEKVRGFKVNRKFYETVERVLSAHYSELQRRVFQDANDFKSWRKLTFAEKKVNFASIQDYMDKAEAKLSDEAKTILSHAKDEYLYDLTKALNDGDVKKIKELSLSYKKEFAGMLKDSLKKSYEFGKNNAAREMGVKAPANSADTLAHIDVLADTIADKHLNEIASEAKIAALDRLTRGENAVTAAAAADTAMTAAIQALTRETSTIVVSGMVNTGRTSVFEKNAAKIYALQRSEILDSVTCNFCLSMDGRIIEKTDDLATFGPFHSNCRGIWVEILNDEAELPDIGGVPNSIRDRLGDAVNELVQPKNAIVKKNSPASKQADKNNASEMSTHPAIYGNCGGRPHPASLTK